MLADVENRKRASAVKLIARWDSYIQFPDNSPITYLEIGAFEGKGLVKVAEKFLRHPKSKAFVIDVFENPEYNYECEFDKLIEKTNLQNKVVKIKGSSIDCLPKLQDVEFDLIFIDGNHTSYHVLSDALYAWRLLKPMGYLIFDDYLCKKTTMYYSRSRALPLTLRPEMAINAFLACLDNQLKVLAIGHQVIVQKNKEWDSPLSSWNGQNSVIESRASEWRYNWQNQELHWRDSKIEKVSFWKRRVLEFLLELKIFILQHLGSRASKLYPKVDKAISKLLGG